MALRNAIQNLVLEGYRYFGTGGALGFDTLAAQAVLSLRGDFPYIKLILVLPCKDQASRWKDTDRKVYAFKCGLDDVNYHALRHTFATRCIEIGFDAKTLSEILGHTSVNLTLNRYVHSSLDIKRANMQMLQL